MSETDDSSEFDIVIVGGGMVGASMAMALEATDYRVALIEAGSFQSAPPASYDERAIALSLGSVQFLERLGVWSHLSADAGAMTQVHISERGGIGTVRLRAERYQVPALGYVLPASALGSAFAEVLPKLKQTTLIENAKVNGLEQHGDGMRLKVAQEEEVTIRCRLVIAADGVGSGIRRALGIGADESDYGHTAVVFNLSADRQPDGTAYERFTTEGPLALLPMSQQRYGVVWTIDHLRQAEVEAMSDDEVIAEIQDRIGFRPGRITRIGQRGFYPLKRVRAQEQIRPRVCVIGNAAHSLHPIGGQGFNLGLRDVMGLAQVLRSNPIDAGSPAVTDAYEAGRLTDQDHISGFTHALANLFGVPGFFPRHLRSAGLAFTEACPPLKQWFARRAMGLDGPVPRFNR